MISHSPHPEQAPFLIFVSSSSLSSLLLQCFLDCLADLALGASCTAVSVSAVGAFVDFSFGDVCRGLALAEEDDGVEVVGP